MMKVLSTIALFLLIHTSGLAETPRTIDRQTALDSALRNNPTYLAAIEDRRSARYSFMGSFSEYLPYAELGWTARNFDGSTNFNSPNTESYTATAGINLFRGFRSFTNVNRARLNLNSLSEAEKETLLQTIRSVNLAYQAALRADYLRTSAHTLFESAEMLLSEAEVRLYLDIITRADLFRARADRERAYSTFLDADVAYRESLLELNRLTGLRLDIHTQLLPDNRVFVLHPLEDYKNAAIANNNALRRSQINKNMAGYSVGFALGAFLPSVDAFATTGWHIDEFGERNAHSVNLSASWNIFSGFYDINNTLANAKSRNSARLHYIQMRDNLIRQVHGAWLRAEVSNDRVSSMEAYVLAAQESYTAAQEMFRLGRASLKDTIDARATLEDAQASLANAQFLRVEAYEELSLLTGGEL
jgi:outer membrane protein TolC